MPRRFHLATLILWLWPLATSAGPPFLTDDPEPVDYRHGEFYAFGTYDRASGGNTVTGPAFEFNYGAIPDLQLHAVIPLVRVSPDSAPAERGLGDTELGVKYRLVDETDDRPQIGIFPMIEAPTSDASRGLGNGQAWYRLPLWIQKSWGPWTSYGGAGYAINRAPGMRNYPFGGWLLQRQLNDVLFLGGELFSQGANTQNDAGYTALNLGGGYAFGKHANLIFSAGHSLAGASHVIGYLGLYYTW